MTKRGYFITFEGIDGCGKSTQLDNVYNFLTEKGIKCVKTREPGSLKLGSQIREILLHYDGEVSNNCEMFLFLADRSQHIDTFIKPMIEEGTIVLCDRHTDSTVAYQGYGRQGNIQMLTELNKIATNGITPDLTLFFDVSVEVGHQRAGKNLDRLELAGKEFFERTRHGYIELAKENPNRIKVVNGEKSKESVYNDVKSLIIDLLGL
ncbi:MAG: dTMP kinase [Candidatus Gastranaerophilaceae bacterium]